MINIPPTGKNDDRPKVRRKSSAAPSSTGTNFKTQLEAVLNRDYSNDIDTLIEELREQERRFINMPDFYEMGRYKALVQKILREISNESFNVKELKSVRSHKENAVTIVETVNDKLLELAFAITKGSPGFALMKTMEEIRGLILDLLQ